jgi:branched-subunit amino acid aminotransferase/4-amino-4-deoxychorismate lyase
LKTGSRLSLQRAFGRARAAGFDDCLLMDAEGQVLETAMGNVFALIDGVWVTPSMELCLLPGICRQWILRRAPIAEATFSAVDLKRARAVAVANAVTGLRAVAAVDRHRYPVAPVEELAAACGKRHFRTL